MPIGEDGFHGDADYERRMAYERELMRSRMLAAGIDMAHAAVSIRRATAELLRRLEDVRCRAQRLIERQVHKILGSDVAPKSLHTLADVVEGPVIDGDFEDVWRRSAEPGADTTHGARLHFYGKHSADL